MKYRVLADTGIRVSEIGFGAWGIGGATPGATSYGDTDDGASCDALAEALDCGINFFDTANVYGEGRSERLIGRVFERSRDRVVIATKAGLHSFDAKADYAPAAIRASLQESLRRLRTDHVDLLQLHNASPAHLLAHPEILGELDALRRDGLIRAYGLSLKSPEEGRDAVESLGVKILQVNLNMLDMRARRCGLTDLAQRAGASLIARTPLCFGFLSGAVNRDTEFAANDHRSRWPASQIRRWIDGAEALYGSVPKGGDGTRGQLALRFCLSFPAVASVIPGMLTSGEVRENSRSSELGPLSADDLGRLDAIYDALDLRVASQDTR
jgi:aryl-alcohol dehydrogenase-like predicted oxidoreductase